MSYIYDSSIIKEKTAVSYSPQKAEEEQKIGKLNVQVFGSASIQSADSTKVQNAGAQSGETGKDSDSSKNSAPEKRDFNIKELVKKYKKNPSEILDQLGINFTNEEKAELKTLLKDKKSLNSFLEIAQEGSLNGKDILEGMKKIKDFKPSGFFKRIGNTIKTLFKEGVSEAAKLAKSETVYYSEKLSGNMGEIREERKDFSSEGVADVAQAVTDKPEIKDNTMHFVQKDQVQGKKLYTEEDVKDAVDVMVKNPKDADKFTNNAVELETIKDKNGIGKYTGKTIINVGKKMTKYEELRLTMLKAAQKSDMNDDYLIGITDNLVVNPDMKEALNTLLDKKDENDKDRFSAANIYDQTTYMVNKDIDKIETYVKNTIDLADNKKLSGDDIVSISGKVTDDPSIKNDVCSQLNDAKSSGSEKVAYSNNSKQTSDTYSTSPFRKSKEAYQLLSKNSLASKKTQNTQNEIYTRTELLKYLYKEFGTVSGKILQKLEENPAFIQLLKKYGSNKDIIFALVNNPSLINKITRMSASITTEQLGKLIKQCTNTEKTEFILASVAEFGPSKAITMAEQTTKLNDNSKILDILNDNTSDSITKKEKIENELYGIGKDREFIC